MKYVKIERNGQPCWGVVKEDTVHTLKGSPYEALEYDGGSYALSACKLLAPCEATKVVCLADNYYADPAQKADSKSPRTPLIFFKTPNSVNTHEGAIHAPNFVEKLDYEGELAVVIKRRAKDVKAKDFADYVLGYTCLNDVTARDIQWKDGQLCRGKVMDGFCPIGPWVVSELDPGSLGLTTRLNGNPVQQGNTSDLITAVPELIEFITASMTLEPGDVIATGTPSGVGPMVPGDVVEVEIEGIGVLKNHVI